MLRLSDRFSNAGFELKSPVMAPLAKVQRDGDAWSLELKIHTLTFARPLGCPSYPNQAQAASRDRWGTLATLAGVPLGSNMARCVTTVHECGVRVGPRGPGADTAAVWGARNVHPAKVGSTRWWGGGTHGNIRN